jgi:lipid A oxidase
MAVKGGTISMRRLGILFSAAFVVAPAVAHAEIQISAYGGMNGASDSDVTLNTPLVTGTYDVDWYGDSFKMPPYWGLRGTWWLNAYELPHWGVAIDFTHTKVKASDLGTIPFSTLEFTDGLNTIGLTGLYRTPLAARFSLYAGAGAGVAFPHVEVRTIPDQGKTFEYQLTGPMVQALLGVSVGLAYGLSVFAEYKANYSWNEADLVGGGTLKTDVLTHQLAVGISLSIGSPPQY